jgi:hypothetical protein
MTKKLRPKRQPTATTVSLAPLSVDEALSAMLKTPPPPSDLKGSRKATKKRKRR